MRRQIRSRQSASKGLDPRDIRDSRENSMRKVSKSAYQS